MSEPESANAPVLAALVCGNPTCAHRGQFVEIHTDTVLPVHCGGCFQVLHCDHDLVTERISDGTIGSPLEHTVTSCRLCGTETQRDTAALPPINLASLPIGILDKPIGS